MPPMAEPLPRDDLMQAKPQEPEPVPEPESKPSEPVAAQEPDPEPTSATSQSSSNGGGGVGVFGRLSAMFTPKKRPKDVFDNLPGMSIMG